MTITADIPKQILLSEIKKLYTEVIELEEDMAWLAIKHPKEYEASLEFILVEALGDEGDGIYCDVLWKGLGYSEATRELRHSYIGDDGYINYLRAKPFVLAFKHLSKYFNDMEIE